MWRPDSQKIDYTAEIVPHASGADRVSYLTVVDNVAFIGSKTSGNPIVLSRGYTLGDRGSVFSPTSEQVAF